MQPGHPAARGRRPRRADRHPHDQGLPPRPRRRRTRDTVIVPDSAHGTNLASATMAGYQVVEIPSSDRGLVDLERPAGHPLRAHRGHHAHQPQHPGPLRGGHPRDLPARARGRRPLLLRRRQPQRHHGQGPPGRHGHGRRPPEPAQDLLHPARRRRPGRGTGGRGRALEPYLPAAAWSASAADAAAAYRSRLRPAAQHRPGEGLLRQRRACSSAPTPTCCAWAGDGLTQASEDAVLNANYLRVRLRDRLRRALRPALHARVRRLGRRRQKHGDRRGRATSPSASSTSACTRPPSTSR